MSILIIGGDRIEPIKENLYQKGVKDISHWDTRKKRKSYKKDLPANINCLLLLTDFLDHNAMRYYRTKAKKSNLPIICSKRSVTCLDKQWCKCFQEDNDEN